MNKTNLRLAMTAVDGAYAEHLMAEAEVAHQTERRSEVLSELAENDAPEIMAAHEAEIAADAARQAEQAIRDQIEAAKAKQGRAYARAFAVVHEALVDGGHNPSCIPDSAALYQRAIAEMLHEIATMTAIPTARRFGSESSEAANGRGADINAILNGRDGGAA